jgi:hypothetical protein
MLGSKKTGQLRPTCAILFLSETHYDSIGTTFVVERSLQRVPLLMLVDWSVP